MFFAMIFLKYVSIFKKMDKHLHTHWNDLLKILLKYKLGQEVI